MIPKKWPKLPKKIFNESWSIVGKSQNPDDDGTFAEIQVSENTKFYFSSKVKKVYDAEKHLITLQGTLVAEGDLFPGEIIGTGTATKDNQQYIIHSVQRPKNIDGSVYLTILELM